MASSRILLFTSWSEVSTPAELSMASVFTNPPRSANSTRARWVSPRLPPSATTVARRSVASMRTASLVRSPTSAWVSVDAFTYVPIPPFHNRSTGAASTALMSSFGVSVRAVMPSRSRTSSDNGTALAERGHTPPPLEILARS
jgi:hypothetical protein